MYLGGVEYFKKRKSMNKKFLLKKIAGTALLISLVISILLGAVSCADKESPLTAGITKEALYENVYTDVSEKDSVLRYIYEWGFPAFNTNKFGTVESLVKQRYYEQLPSDLLIATRCAELFLQKFYDNIDLNNFTTVTDALLKCYMASIGDDYAVYRVASEQQTFSEDITGGGSFVGIGVHIVNTDPYSQNGLLYVSGVYENSGASNAGIIPGDIIVSVDGVSAATAGYKATAEALKGEDGSFVNVGVMRGGELLPEFTVERCLLPEISVYTRFDEQTGYGYVSIMSFQKSTSDEFAAAIDELEALGAVGIIFDLRNNLGGVLTAVHDNVSYLVDDEIPFISYTSNGEQRDPEKTHLDSHKLDIPMVVLVNEFTASAAEIFAAALRDYRDCPELGASNRDITIVGSKTYGKGVMQQTVLFSSDGSSVTFTTAYYNPPSGVNYNGIGIIPDEGYEVDRCLGAQGDAQLIRAYEALSEYFESDAA